MYVEMKPTMLPYLTESTDRDKLPGLCCAQHGIEGTVTGPQIDLVPDPS
jgi:hypothetical protein